MIAVAALAVVVLVGAGLVVVRPWSQEPTCPPMANHPEGSVARRGGEALLDAIRRALPAPTIHARNLFHASAAMWDAWAAYDPHASGYVVNEKLTASDVAAARNEAISYAAYRVLSARYIKAVGAADSLSEFDDIMDGLCYPLDVTTTDGDSPAALGNRIGHPVNPVTGKPYDPDVVNQGDFARALTEFWADGPKSETPPGHWNVVANTVSDQLAPNLRIGGTGPTVDRLEWDVKLYFALNGATHDAAIAAWGLKGYYDSVRPISMIRYMASLGQSSDPSLPSYDREGLPLAPGLVELITTETTGPGQRHAALAGHEGGIAIRAWMGNPKDPKTQTGGVGWVLGIAWVPYQVPTFVTPSFPGYVSGHSTFSRASAEVLTSFTGSEYFPGGLSEWTTKAGSLTVEAGPTKDVTLEWATYYDAADQAGLSRLYGGIHIPADDFAGRKIGSQCGKAAWALAQQYYGGQVGS